MINLFFLKSTIASYHLCDPRRIIIPIILFESKGNELRKKRQGEDICLVFPVTGKSSLNSVILL